MSLKITGILASCVAVLVLAGCSAPAIPMEATKSQPVTKEAGVSGSRVCFSNATGVLMSVAPAGEPIQGTQDIGPAGEMTDKKEICFAGWNSRRYTDWITDDFGKGFFQVYNTDVAVAVSIDGAYNALTLRANNVAFARPDLTWTDDPTAAQTWTGGAMSDGAVLQGSVAGHSFTVTRRDDSDNYKEFLVRFTK